MTARDEMVDYGIGEGAADRIAGSIHDHFDDYLIVAEENLGRGGALTRSQLIFIESLYRNYNIGREREIWEGLKGAPERERSAAERPAVRREVVVILGRRRTFYRDLHTGRWVRRPGRK
jgi:hypothetical protein